MREKKITVCIQKTLICHTFITAKMVCQLLVSLKYSKVMLMNC